MKHGEPGEPPYICDKSMGWDGGWGSLIEPIKFYVFRYNLDFSRLKFWTVTSN